MGRSRDLRALDRAWRAAVRGVETQERAVRFFEQRGNTQDAERARQRLAATEARLDDLLTKRVLYYPPPSELRR
jgi:hypothetical protein